MTDADEIIEPHDLKDIFALAKTRRQVRVKLGRDVFLVTFENTQLPPKAREHLAKGTVTDDAEEEN